MISVRTSSQTLTKSVSTEPDHGEHAWRDELRQAVRDVDQLCRLLELPAGFSADVGSVRSPFPLLVPHSFIRRMQQRDPDDPLLKQVLPIADENMPAVGFTADPVNELAHTPGNGLIHKYRGRALLITASACAVHCRYCFRREFPYETTAHGTKNQRAALETVAGDNSIREVILSGGDPLMLVDGKIEELLGLIASIPHVKRIRIHTRMPVMIPARVTSRLVRLLVECRLTPYFVVHINHVNEIDAELESAVTKLIDAGVPVLNQAVLLRGVNDSVESLAALFERLADIRVLPYYLHQLDRVTGAAHFEVTIQRGVELMRELHQRLPGYALPRYVVDDGTSIGKQILF